MASTASLALIPALDLRQGRVVRLTNGDFEKEQVYPGDPVTIARGYQDAGASSLHVVDLDAARGDARQVALVEQVVRQTDLRVQVAGGVRDEAAVERWLERGAAYVVLGTAAVQEPALLREIASQHPGRLQAALDVRGGAVAVSGWMETQAELTIPNLLHMWNEASLAGVILTSVDRDGTLGGPDLEMLQLARASTQHRLTYSGGIARLSDLARVRDAGADAVILGKSLLDGRFTLAEALAAV